MKHRLYLSLLLISSLYARENPFFDADASGVQKVTSNVPDKLPQLESESYTFPNQARVLKEVTFTIQNLDGSVETRKMPVDKNIDWHRPVIISQQGAQSAQNTLSASVNADFDFIRFEAKGKRLIIKTAAPLIRNFVLSDPDRIVLDFKHNPPFITEQKPLNKTFFTNVTLGNHGKFLRATITLDGRYVCSVNKNGSLITITCK